MQSLFLDEFFSLLLEISHFYYLIIFKYFSFSSVNSVAAEFQFFFRCTCFIAILSSCNRGISRTILGLRLVEESLACLSVKFKQYWGKCPST